MQLIVRQLEDSPDLGEVEIVERKGLGHPDTLCDAIAELVCVRLCRHYLDRFGMILHHNVDKVLLCGGASRPAFGGGVVVEPIEIYLAGRATRDWQGTAIPVDEIAVEACRELLERRLSAIDVERHVRIIPRIRPGSVDLSSLFNRNSEAPLSNDTSCGTGFAPLSRLERAVLAVERCLNDGATKAAHPAIGSDVKVMGVRQGDHVSLTVGCAFIGRHLDGIDDYNRAKETVVALARDAAHAVAELDVEVAVNAADDVDAGDVYLTVLGTSAESGDDGEVGRGNRTNGLITPYRPMTMEAAAGKNPMTHVGKLYNVIADRICAAVAARTPQVTGAACILVSQIGHRVDDPWIADVRIGGGADLRAERERVLALVEDELRCTAAIRKELLAESVSLY